MATLQVSHLDDQARIDDPAFRQSFVSSIGGIEPQQERLGDRLVWLTTGTEQRLSIWFAGRYLMVLAVRNDYERPRGLLRSLLAVQP